MDQIIKIWDDGTLKGTLNEHLGTVRYLLQFPNADLVSTSRDETIKIWDFITNTVKYTLTGHRSGILCLELLTNGDLASGSVDTTIIIWK